MPRSLLVVASALVAGLLASPSAHAGLLDARQTFAVGAEVGGVGRWFDHPSLADRSAWGLELGVRAEVNAFVHARVEAHYFDSKLFHADQDRLFTVSTSARSPKLFLFALDLQELYFRTSTRPGDDLLYAHAGLGVVGDLVGTLKGGLGFTYVAAPGIDDERERAMGAYVGASYVLRTKFVETALRATLFVAFADQQAHVGATTDGDLMVRIAVHGVYLGPRFTIAYRNLGVSGPALFGQRQEVTATGAFACLWGTGIGKPAARR
jgi:hypothetical protein